MPRSICLILALFFHGAGVLTGQPTSYALNFKNMEINELFNRLVCPTTARPDEVIFRSNSWEKRAIQNQTAHAT